MAAVGETVTENGAKSANEAAQFEDSTPAYKDNQLMIMDESN